MRSITEHPAQAFGSRRSPHPPALDHRLDQAIIDFLWSDEGDLPFHRRDAVRHPKPDPGVLSPARDSQCEGVREQIDGVRRLEYIPGTDGTFDTVLSRCDDQFFVPHERVDERGRQHSVRIAACRASFCLPWTAFPIERSVAT